MGKFKDSLIDIGLTDLDGVLTSPVMSEQDLIGLQVEAVGHELTRLRDVIDHLLEREKYYKEPITRENVELLREEITRTLRNLA